MSMQFTEMFSKISVEFFLFIYYFRSKDRLWVYVSLRTASARWVPTFMFLSKNMKNRHTQDFPFKNGVERGIYCKDMFS